LRYFNSVLNFLAAVILLDGQCSGTVISGGHSIQWLYLLIAGLFEIAWAIGLKYTDGFTKALPTALTIAGMIASFYFLAQALKTIPVGTAYAVWTGIGACGTAILGIALFGESAAPNRMICLLLIVAGLIGLKIVSD